MTRVWRRDARALWRRSGQRAIVLAPGRDDHLLLTGTAYAIWQLLTEPMDESAVADAVAAAYGVEADQVGAELQPFLEDLLAAGALEVG